MFKYFIMDRFDELNDRLMNRDKFNMDGNIKFDIRSTPTRNTFPFPIVEKKIECKTKFSNVTKDYNKEIEIETNLMNRSYPLQHGASQSVYVPSSTSDLYNVTMSIPSYNPIQPYPDLFQDHQYKTTDNKFITNSYVDDIFNNCSRSQRNVEKQSYTNENKKK